MCWNRRITNFPDSENHYTTANAETYVSHTAKHTTRMRARGKTLENRLWALISRRMPVGYLSSRARATDAMRRLGDAAHHAPVDESNR
jgi:hypothetical protein